ncbi:MAG: PorV/PorQ family protein [Cyclobacteriaceae bacterium]|nr:PorV/PorQ family protein [Cyclobacteriaceae bacterium]
MKNDYGFSLSYSPWLSHIVGDMSLTYLSGYYKINKEQTVAFSMNYFDLGNVQFTDENGSITQDFVPREYVFAGSYGRILAENMSVGVTLKYIYSNLTGNYFAGTLDDAQPGVSLAADLGWYWNNDIGQNSNLALGTSITNIGNKVTYTDDNQKEFIPTNLRLGSAYKFELDPHNTITLALDFNKLMVPTPPVYAVDENGAIIYEE